MIVLVIGVSLLLTSGAGAQNQTKTKGSTESTQSDSTTGKIQGKVFRSDMKTPFVNAVVLLKGATLQTKGKTKPTIGNLMDLMSESKEKKGVIAETKSDKGGHYSFTKVKAGEYYIIARLEMTEELLSTKSPCKGNSGNNNDGWLITLGKTTVEEFTKGTTTVMLIIAARGENFEIKAGQLLQRDIDFTCKAEDNKQ